MKRRRIGTLMAQELTVASRSRFHFIILLILAVSTAVVYLIPDEMGMESTIYVYTEPGAELQGNIPGEPVDSAEELKGKTAEKSANRGVLVKREETGLSVVYYYNGELSEREANLISAGLKRMVSLISEPASGTAVGSDLLVRTLTEDAQPMDNGRKMLLILLAFEVVVIGFLFSAVIIFQEKQEGTLRAFRVTPGGAAVYLTSKTVFWTAVGIIYGALMLFSTTLFSLTPRMWLHIMSAVVLSALFYTLLGIGVAVYFNTISEWFIIGVVILIINMLPLAALEFPALANPVLEWIPSHPFLFWLRSIFQEGGRNGTDIALVSAGKIALFVVLGAVFAGLSVRRKVMKEAIR